MQGFQLLPFPPGMGTGGCSLSFTGTGGVSSVPARADLIADLPGARVMPPFKDEKNEAQMGYQDPGSPSQRAGCTGNWWAIDLD